MSGPLSCPCAAPDLALVHEYRNPPAGETRFAAEGAPYRRRLRRCRGCGHLISEIVCGPDLGRLYRGGYVSATYGAGGLRQAFERIVALPPEASDNLGRVARVRGFAARRLGSEGGAALLDVGSGLGVFVHAMAAAGWTCTALDPDARAAAHARERVGVESVHGSFEEFEPGRRFDLVSFNKVLEHVERPGELLARARRCLSRRGFVYVEVPDAETAWGLGPEREELFIEHIHGFSRESLRRLCAGAGFAVAELTRLHEPSDKRTLAAFLLAPAAGPGPREAGA